MYILYIVTPHMQYILEIILLYAHKYTHSSNSVPVLCSFTANKQAMARDVAVSADSSGVVMYSAMAKMASSVV